MTIGVECDAFCIECGAPVVHRNGAWICPTHFDRAHVRFEPRETVALVTGERPMPEPDVECFEYVRPAEFATDKDWAQSMADDMSVLRERLASAEWALADITGSLRSYEQTKAEFDEADALINFQEQPEGN